MIVQLYAVRDKKTETFMTPVFQQTKGAAIRSFTDAMQSKEQNNLNQHPEDYSLYEVGKWDDQKGVIISQAEPEQLITGLDISLEK